MLLRTTLAALIRTVGADGQGTLATEGYLIEAMGQLGEYAEAEVLGQESLAKHLRVLGRDHYQTLSMSTNLAVSLLRQGKFAEAAEIEREVLLSSTRLLGAEHESTLISAPNLALSVRALDPPPSAWHALFSVSGGLAVLLVGLTYLATR